LTHNFKVFEYIDPYYKDISAILILIVRIVPLSLLSLIPLPADLPVHLPAADQVYQHFLYDTFRNTNAVI
jgi:hypothetical protein